MRLAHGIKILQAGWSCHGGDLAWSLPTRRQNGTWKPGKWQVAQGPLQICQTGLHLTDKAHIGQWWRPGQQCYLAEASPARAANYDATGHKTLHRRVRLLRPYTPTWIRQTEACLREVRDCHWLAQHLPPLPEWRVTVAASRDASRAASRDASRDASWAGSLEATLEVSLNASREASREASLNACREASWDAATYVTSLGVCHGLPLAEEHRALARQAWEVWRRGWGLAAIVDGVCYVYGINMQNRSREQVDQEDGK